MTVQHIHITHVRTCMRMHIHTHEHHFFVYLLLIGTSVGVTATMPDDAVNIVMPTSFLDSNLIFFAYLPEAGLLVIQKFCF